MNKICTSIKQSKKLMKLGIDINTGDMDYVPFANNPEEYDCVINVWNNEHEEDWIPAWSLTALLELIPAGNILLRDALSKNYKCINTVDSDLYDNPLDAAFEMVCWLKENGKI